MFSAAILDGALTLRLYPHTGLSPKQLAFALGISDDTLWRYRTGRTQMSARALVALLGYFRSQGDTALEHELLGGAREAYDRIRLAAAPGTSWFVERLSLDALEHPRARSLARIAAAGGDLLTAADNAGLLRDCSLFRRTGSEVVNLWIGGSSGMRPTIRDSMLGRPTEAWPDFSFARLVKEHVLAVKEDEPTYHYLEGRVHDIWAPYRRSAFVSGDIVVTLTERLAA